MNLRGHYIPKTQIHNMPHTKFVHRTTLLFRMTKSVWIIQSLSTINHILFVKAVNPRFYLGLLKTMILLLSNTVNSLGQCLKSSSTDWFRRGLVQIVGPKLVTYKSRGANTVIEL